MFFVREVIRFVGDPSRDARVVWADARDIWLFDLAESRTVLTRWRRADLEAALDAGRVTLVKDHGHDAFRVDAALSKAQRTRRDAIAKVIEPLVARAPSIFDVRERGSAVAMLDRTGVRSAKTVHMALDRWWRRGMTPDALVPAFDGCGGGERRSGARKPGRKQPPGVPQGVPITPETMAVFQTAIRRHYGNERRNSLSAVYELMRGESFVDEVRDPTTGAVSFRVKPEYAETGFPTLRQFRFWYSKHPDRLEHRRKRLGAASYEKDNRAVTGSASEHLMGAGSRFEIDATQLEIGTVSGVDLRSYVGMPTFYQVTDVLTSLVCGIYVGYEEPNWTGAGLAVRNIVEDKVEFARRFGVTIAPHEWPCQGVLPKRLLADNAEFKGDLATDFTAKSFVTVENATALRGDMKGTVESKFALFKRELRKRLPGLRKRNHADPYAADYSRDACLTLEQITAAVIEVVVLLNNRKISGRVPTRAMMEAGVFAVPSEMWAWAVRTGATEVRSFDVATAEFAMLPSAYASVTKHGICFRKLYYAGDDTRDDAFARARQDGVSRVRVSFDELHTTVIYVHDGTAPRGFREVSLVGASKEYRDLGFKDAARQMAADDAHTKNLQFRQAELDARFGRSHEALTRKAKAARPSKLTNTEVAAEKQNRPAARERERRERRSALRPGNGDVATTGTVVLAAEFAERQRRQSNGRTSTLAPHLDPLGEDDFNDFLRGGSK